MCGNFGLLALANNSQAPQENTSQHSFHKPKTARDDLDASVSESMHQVSRLQGMRYNEQADETAYSPTGIDKMLSPVKILEAQTACTEIRGGQSGGYSSIEYKYLQQEHKSRFEAMFGSQLIAIPKNYRVRMVARKRHPLAADLSALYMRQRGGQHPDPTSTITVIGHTRFATSSVNVVPELHPHEWVPFHDEVIWKFNTDSGRFERSKTLFGLHITHNGDFDAMEAYSSIMVVDEIGLWLERALHCPNNTRGDSPKVAGCMDLMRVQGRWAASARLSWLRCVAASSTEVSGGIQLTKAAPNTFPPMSYWELWATIFEKLWPSHINNVIIDLPPNKFDLKKKHAYRIDRSGLEQFQLAMVEFLTNEGKAHSELGIESWNLLRIQSFVHHAVRGFLYADLYTVMTEILSRAEGSFGLQAHCTMEPGVVVIASKGQPMSIAFDPSRPIVLFASEAEALAVPVYESGKWLPQRIDLDSKGEIVRVGEPRALQEGSFGDLIRTPRNNNAAAAAAAAAAKKGKAKKTPSALAPTASSSPVGISLDCGVEIRCYSLVSCKEAKMDSMIERCVAITSAPLPYDPKVDLVANDLKVTPAVLDAIDHAWSNPHSIERLTGQAFAEALIKSMQVRVQNDQDVTDLVIGGVEVSLWMAEQWAADLRRVFPNLNITTTSTNKLLGVGDDNPSKVFFPGAEEVLSRRIGPQTLILLVSQSGQTFPSLHATRKLATLYPEKLFILTGCFNSKMEQALMEAYRLHGLKYGRNRVFNNYSGHRPAEPSSVAVAATWHTFTKLLLHLVDVSRQLCPAGRMIHPWDYDEFAWVIQKFFLRYVKHRAHHVKAEEEAGVSGFFMGHDASESKEQQQQQQQRLSKMSRVSSAKTYKMDTLQQKGKHQVIMTLSDGCIHDIQSLITENLIPNIAQIVGYDHFGNRLLDRNGKEDPESTHSLLIQQGLDWATHVLEPWNMLIWAAIYIFLSVALGLPIVGLIADAILRIVRACGADLPYGIFAFTPRVPSIMRDQPIGYTLLGLLFQCLDALFYIFIGKNLTRVYRLCQGRPLAARHGTRTIVVVDNACVHQLVESFVSKLFSQSYSIVSVDVHGASGLDHFVHRFTHRVVRGLLIAVGRPDGRLCCLAKSEMATLLATKQAAFIRNPDYEWEGNGPEIVTVGHNPFQPNVGLAKHIVLHGGFHRTTAFQQLPQTSHTINNNHNHSNSNSVHQGGARAPRRQSQLHLDQQALTMAQNRNKFVDEYLYERLFLAKKPFTVPILRALRRTVESGHYIVKSQASRHGTSSTHHQGSAHNNSSHHNASQHRPHHYFHSMHNLNSSVHSLTNHSRTGASTGTGTGTGAGAGIETRSVHRGRRQSAVGLDIPDEILPYGVHHIDPTVLIKAGTIETTIFADFVTSNWEYLNPKILEEGLPPSAAKFKSNDPSVRLAFSAKLDSMSRQIQDLQVVVQQLYECRVASLERYLAFCVMFHAMAKKCSTPWFLYPWDIARSQSNLRVATTASPISAGGGDSHEVTTEVKQLAKDMVFKLRKVQVNF